MKKVYDNSGHLLTNPPKWLLIDPNTISKGTYITVSSEKEVGK